MTTLSSSPVININC